jgi:L-ascorbate metabolism protein UlaG (beta-lactamase superfamily)
MHSSNHLVKSQASIPGLRPPAPPVTLTLGGNAAVLVEAPDVRIATDPWLSPRVGPWSRLRPPGFTREDLARVDLVAISHAHPDHLCPWSLELLGPDAEIVTPNGTPRRVLERAGVPSLRVMEAWEEAATRGAQVTAVPSVHTRWSLGYVLDVADRRIYFAGDAGPHTPFAEIARRCGPFDVALIPVGGSTLARGRLQRHLTPKLAASAARALRPRCVVPMHWGHMACVPAALDRFRGTADRFLEVMQTTAPDIAVLCPDDGVPTTI